MTALRLTRVLAWATVVAAGVLLTLGWLVTSFRAGMADPVWPTEPWYLVVNGQVWQESKAGFLLEHTHRAAGWVVGGLTTLLALAAWATDPRPGRRWFGLAAALGLAVVYGQFHREMGVAWEERKAGTGGVFWPASGPLTLAAAVVLGVAVAVTAGRGWVLRRLASLALVAVMVQGLLGGYRVYLDQLLGAELAVVHGVFGQAVFCLLLVVLVLSRPLPKDDEVAAGDRDRLGTLTLLLPAAVFVQLVWGSMTRHQGGTVAQRLHLLTAFAVTGLAVWLAVRLIATPLRGKAYHLLGVVAVQVTLGVEAWMGKFAAAGPEAAVPPMLRHLTPQAAGTRTLHALVGAVLLATAVLLAVRIWRRAEKPDEPTAQAAEMARAAAVAAA